jgi:hypothetical protein
MNHKSSNNQPAPTPVQKPRVRMLIPLWGAKYFERWFELPAASLRSAGNIPYLQSRTDFEIVFLTKSQDIPFLLNNQVFNDFAAGTTVRTVTIDEFFPSKGTVSYGVPLTLAFAKGIRDLGKDGLGTFVILMNADFVLSEGSLRSLVDRIEQGYQIITAPSIRVTEHVARPLKTEELYSGNKGRGFAARDMMGIVEKCLHDTVVARVINEPQLIETSYYHLIYWRINESCLAARYFLLMPLCFQVCRHFETVTSPVDYGFLEQLCPGGRYTVLADSDEFLMVELQHQHSEAYLLAPAQKFSSCAEAIDHKISQAIKNAAEWTTFEHRRAIANTLLFHSQDLPVDIQSKLLEFDAYMARMLATLPPPVPAQRHFHWLGAVHHYRQEMHPDSPQLLVDELNSIVIELFEVDRKSVSEARPQWSSDADLMRRLGVIEHFRSCSAVVTLDGLLSDLRALPQSVRIFPAKLGDAHSTNLDMRFCFPDDFFIENGKILGLYLFIDSLPHWCKFRALCDRAIEAGGSAILLFRTTNGLDMKLQDNPWILSQLLQSFGSEFYSTEMELIRAPRDVFALQDPTTGAGMFPWRGMVVPPDAYLGFVIRLAGPVVRQVAEGKIRATSATD